MAEPTSGPRAALVAFSHPTAPAPGVNNESRLTKLRSCLPSLLRRAPAGAMRRSFGEAAAPSNRVEQPFSTPIQMQSSVYMYIHTPRPPKHPVLELTPTHSTLEAEPLGHRRSEGIVLVRFLPVPLPSYITCIVERTRKQKRPHHASCAQIYSAKKDTNATAIHVSRGATVLLRQWN